MPRPAPKRELSTAAMRQAFGQLKAHGHAADPRNYELWYVYASGDKPALNTAIHATLAENRVLASGHLDQIYDDHLSPVRSPQQVVSVGAKIVDEIDQVIAMIEAAEGSASAYSADLDGLPQRLKTAKDREGLRTIVESLVHATREMESANGSLKARLDATRNEVVALRATIEVIRAESATDALTSLYNRSHFDRAIADAISQATASQEPLCLLLADIDHFKRLNDTHGHVAGDEVLRLIGKMLREAVKEPAVAARYGGEEFAVILPNTSLSDAGVFAERIRADVAAREIIKRSTGETLTRLTLSIGAAMMHPGEPAQALIEAADACLYAAKRSGRNRIVGEADGALLSSAS